MSTPTVGYAVKQHSTPTKRFVQTLELRDDPKLISAYREIHSQPKIWKEILDGIRQVGILEMEIYILGTRLVMILEMPAELDFNAAMTELATLPRQAEWEAMVDKFQNSTPGQASSEKWQMMERMFHLYE